MRLLEQTPAQKIGLPKSPQEKKTTLFETFAWIIAWATLLASVVVALICFDIASNNFGAAADIYGSLGVFSLMSGGMGFVICGGVAKILEHLSSIEKKIRN